MPQTLPQIISHQAAVNSAAAALWWQGSAISYRQLQQAVTLLSERLASQGAVGERVAVLAWNCVEFVEMIYAVPASGKILVPLNARLAPQEWLYQLQAAGVTRVFGDAQLLESLRAQPDLPDGLECTAFGEPYERWLQSGPQVQPPQCHSDDPVWILYTSGSTARPKGAVLTHSSFLAALETAAVARPVYRQDRYYYPFPLFHVAAHNVLLQHRYGAAVVLAQRFDAEQTLQTCRALKVTSMSLAPTMISLLLDHPTFSRQDLASVRSIGYGASAMPETVLQRLLQQTSIGLCQSYGMTELSGSVAFLTPEDHQRCAVLPQLRQSVGKPVASAQLKLVNDAGEDCAVGEAGEIVVRSKQCMREYWQQPEATAKALRNGWLFTGDIGRFDSDGYLYLVDRKKDMIVSGGENVASREVEEVLRQHAAVRDCAVIGQLDPHWGERVVALLQLNQAVEDEALAAHCRSHLANYKTPRKWYRLDHLPLNAAGKVDKPLLRERYPF